MDCIKMTIGDYVIRRESNYNKGNNKVFFFCRSESRLAGRQFGMQTEEASDTQLSREVSSLHG